MTILAQLEAAAALVRTIVPPTPQYCWPLLSRRIDAEVWVKHENHTPIGAFKIRGGLVYLDAVRRSEPNLRGKIHTIAVSSGPYKKERQAQRALDEAIEKATAEYIADQIGSQRAALLLRYDAGTIKERYLRNANKYQDVARYTEPVGDMHEHFALLEFGPDFRKEIDRRWMQVKATSRVVQTGVVSGAVLLLIASVFGYFRLDNATRGYYTSRLQFMTAAAILAVVTAGVVAAQYMAWL